MPDRLKQRALALSRPWKRGLTVTFDVVALLAIVWIAYYMRLGLGFRPNGAQVLLALAAPAIAVP
ncbi:MAG: hypothetical protein ABI377_01255, partial [Devosia sp.]